MIRARQYREMDNSQCNGAGAPPAEEQVQRVEETVAFGDPQGGPPGTATKPDQVQTETAQNTVQGDAAAPLETGTRKRTDAEKQRAAEAKAVRTTALTEQEQERQLRLVIEQEELCKCMNSGMGILTPDQVRRVVNAVTGTNKGPMEAIRGLSVQPVTLGEGNPQGSSAVLGQAAESAVQALVASAQRAKEWRWHFGP